MFFIWQNFGLCTVLPPDGLTGRWFDFRYDTHRLVLFLCYCVCNKLKGSSRSQRRLATISTVSTFAFTIHSRATANLQCLNVFTFVLHLL